MKYAHYDEENGKLIGFYDSKIHSTVKKEIKKKTTKDKKYFLLKETELIKIKCKNVEIYKKVPIFDNKGKEIEYDIEDLVTYEYYKNIINIPFPYIEITYNQYKEALEKNYNFVDVKNNLLKKKDFMTLEKKRSRKIKEINRYYEKENEKDIEYKDTTFQADKNSQDLILSTISASLGELPKDFYWIDSKNNEIPFSIDDLKMLAKTIFLRSYENFNKCKDLKREVQKYKTKNKIEKVILK